MSEIIQPLSRRDLFRTTGAVVAVAILAGCDNKPAPTPEIYHGIHPNLEGRPIITTERFEKLTKALANSGEPLLGKAGRDVTTLKTSSSNLQDLPSFVSEDSTPLIITRDFTVASYASFVADIDTENPGFILDQEPKPEEWHFAKPVNIAIHLGSSENMDSSDPLQESILLAKEEIGLMLGLQVFAGYNENFLHEGVQELDGSEMTDPDKLTRASYTIGFSAGVRDDSMLWRLNDIAPMMLLAPTVYDLVVAGKLPESSADLGPLYKVVNAVFSDPELMQYVIKLQKMWAESKSIYGPDGFASYLFDPKILDALDLLYKELYPDVIN